MEVCKDQIFFFPSKSMYQGNMRKCLHHSYTIAYYVWLERQCKTECRYIDEVIHKFSKLQIIIQLLRFELYEL